MVTAASPLGGVTAVFYSEAVPCISKAFLRIKLRTPSQAQNKECLAFPLHTPNIHKRLDSGNYFENQGFR